MRNIFYMLLIILISCTEDQAMRIQYAEVNGFHADYIFNLKNDSYGLKMILDYINTSNREAQHHNDSLVVEIEKKFKDREPTDEEYLANSFPNGATDAILYSPPSEMSLDRVQEQDVIINFIMEGEYKIKDIEVSDRFLEKDISVNEISTNNNKTILNTNKPFNLGVLKNVMQKIHELKYHLKYKNYTYEIDNDVEKLIISYNNQGKYLDINFISK